MVLGAEPRNCARGSLEAGDELLVKAEAISDIAEPFDAALNERGSKDVVPAVADVAGEERAVEALEPLGAPHGDERLKPMASSFMLGPEGGGGADAIPGGGANGFLLPVGWPTRGC